MKNLLYFCLLIYIIKVFMNYGFVKVAAAVPRVKVADCKFNASQIERWGCCRF